MTGTISADYAPVEDKETVRHGKDLLDELRGYGDQKQKEAMIEALTWPDIELLQAQELTDDERRLILDIIEPVPSHNGL